MILANDLGKHTYLREKRPTWRGSRHTIRQQGGPWYCPSCGTASLLHYRCSACGKEGPGVE